MRFLAIILLLVSFPCFLACLRSKHAQGWAFVALGALPILQVPLNLNAALISWASWPGHTKGLLLTLADPLALAICVRYAFSRPIPPMWWVFGVYLASLLPGVLVGKQFQPAFFYVFQTALVMVGFYATYLGVMNGQLVRIAQGIALSVFVNGLVTIKEALGGAARSAGLLGHQNFTGLTVNLCVPLLLALGLQKNRSFFLVAAAAGGVSALTGDSRATIIFYGVAVIATLIGSAIVRPTSRKIAIGFVISLALVAALPLAIRAISDRGGVLNPDLERVAFERAARAMIHDHPWGVGINQYVVFANTEGYLSRAGVRWGSGARGTNVHNFYLLARTEGGLIELVGVLMWFFVPLTSAIWLACQKKAPLRDIAVAIGVGLAITAAHNRYEWIFVTMVPQYLAAELMGIVAAIMAFKRSALGARVQSAPRRNRGAAEPALAAVDGLVDRNED